MSPPDWRATSVPNVWRSGVVGKRTLDGNPAVVLNLSDMATLTSAEAAERLGVNVQRFHRLVHRHGVNPVLVGPGIRGPKFWNAADIDRLRHVTGDGDAA